MSRAGKFIPGGAGKGKRTGPIRAPEPEPPAGTPGAPKKRPFNKASLSKPVAKNLKLPIIIMSAFVCCLLVSVAWYVMAYLPAQRQLAQLRLQIQADADQRAKDAADQKVKDDLAAKLAAETKCVLILTTNPPGAKAIIGDFNKTTPAKFDSITPGNISLLIQLDGYEDYRQDVTVAIDKPVDLGTIQLVQKAGTLSITSPQSDVTYTLTGPNGYTHDGQIPDKLDKLPIGDYSIVATQRDWKLPAKALSIRDNETTQKIIDFPYAKVSITSTPSGATIRDGRTVLGQTPLSMAQVHPRDFHVTVDLPPYATQHLDFHVPDFGSVNKSVNLQADKDFIAASGEPMVWIADGGFWVGKYEFRQRDFEAVVGYNPSNFRGPNKPVETISWESAMAFIDKLNKFEAKAGKLPSGFHYSLPRESQWDMFNDGSNIDLAATSRVDTLTSTQDVGYSEPNKYGIYDTLGNVWEWCLDDFDDKGNHSLRGGCWLSSAEHFAGAGTRQAGGLKYADQFTGFRVVLVPN
jgi:Sulfatase-modifying factor enzyme 1/PEGA domain